MEPNDVDCVLLVAKRPNRDRLTVRELRRGLPFLDISMVNQRDFDKFVGSFFAADRHAIPKGMIEVISWT